MTLNERYLIVRVGTVEHLLGLADSQSRSIASSGSRLDIYDALLRDIGVELLQFDAAPAPTKQTIQAQNTEAGICGFCRQQRIKDGTTRDGRQRWRCPKPHNERQEVRSARAERRGKKFRRGGRDFHKNPKCPTCQKPMHIAGGHRGVTYYKCKQGCAARGRGKGWSSLNLPTSDGSARDIYQKVEALVSSVNGYDPAIRADIVQEIMLDLELKKILLSELDRETVRRYVRSQQSLAQRKGRDVSLEARTGQGEQTIGDTLSG